MKEKILKSVALAMCALLLSLSVATAYPVQVQAAGTTEASLYKLVDMALTKTGIVANDSIISTIVDTLTEHHSDLELTYEEYLELNGYEDALAVLKTYYENEDICDTCKKIIQTILLENSTEEEYQEYRGLVEGSRLAVCGIGSSVIELGSSYTIIDEFVELVRDLFDDMSDAGQFGYFYVDTFAPDEIPSSWFSTATSYKNFQAYVKSSENTTVLSYEYLTLANTTLRRVYDNRTPLLFVRGTALDAEKTLYFYDDNWAVSKPLNIESNGTISASYTDGDTFYSAYESYASSNTVSLKSNISSYIYPYTASNKYTVAFATSDGRKQIIYTNLANLKEYNDGQKPFYVVTTNDYSSDVDNSIDFTGSYYQDNSSTYTYDVVQQEIDNSTEINEETINNIVNTSTTTIINNYYTSSDEDSSGSDDSGSTGEGLASLLEGIGSFLDFLLGLIGDVVSLLTTFLDSALTLIGSLGSLFGDFGALLGDLFVFIPQECIDAITAGITLLIFVMIYKAFK